MCSGDPRLLFRRHPLAGGGMSLSTQLPVGFYVRILLEVSVVESLESSSVTSLILAHLVYCIVDSIKVLLLCESCDSLLVLACALLSEHSLLYICLGIPYALTEELSELSCVLSLFPCISLESLSD